MLCSPQASSITESEAPSAVFRKTSLTARQRLTPASACSTRTRTRRSLRLAHRTVAVSSPPAGFFFRPAGRNPRRRVALEAAVLVQGGPRRIRNRLPVRHPLVRRAARVRPAQEADPSAGRLGDHHVAVAV